MAPGGPVILRPAPFVKVDADGLRSLHPRPTRAELLAHAAKYGTELVADTAAESMDVESLTSLIAQLDRLDTKAASGRRYTVKRRGRVKSPEERAMEMLGIEPEEEEARWKYGCPTLWTTSARQPPSSPSSPPGT